METTYFYDIMLKNGTMLKVSRLESEGKQLIGLWNWAQKQANPVVVSFNECSIHMDEIAVIYAAKTVEELDPTYYGEVANVPTPWSPAPHMETEEAPPTYAEQQAMLYPSETAEEEKEESEPAVAVEEFEPEHPIGSRVGERKSAFSFWKGGR